jgi:hypothetical protein
MIYNIGQCRGARHRGQSTMGCVAHALQHMLCSMAIVYLPHNLPTPSASHPRQNSTLPPISNYRQLPRCRQPAPLLVVPEDTALIGTMGEKPKQAGYSRVASAALSTTKKPGKDASARMAPAKNVHASTPMASVAGLEVLATLMVASFCFQGRALLHVGEINALMYLLYSLLPVWMVTLHLAHTCSPQCIWYVMACGVHLGNLGRVWVGRRDMPLYVGHLSRC